MMREPMNFTGYLHLWTLVLVVFMLNTCGKRFFLHFFCNECVRIYVTCVKAWDEARMRQYAAECVMILDRSAVRAYSTYTYTAAGVENCLSRPAFQGHSRSSEPTRTYDFLLVINVWTCIVHRQIADGTVHCAGSATYQICFTKKFRTSLMF